MYSYLIGTTTAKTIIRETCQVIWDILSKKVMPGIFKTDDWLRISAGFEDEWNFPHCIGSIDGKHVAIEVNK